MRRPPSPSCRPSPPPRRPTGTSRRRRSARGASVAVAIRSRSRTVSRKRRAEPAIDTCTAAGCAATSASTARSFGSVVPEQRAVRLLGGLRLRELDEDPLLELRARARRPCAARCASAAARRSATVVIPSSCQSRRAVFGPSPGSRMNVATSGGTSALRLVSACDLAGPRPPGRSSPRSSCRSPAAPSRARRARAGRRSSTSRGSAWPPCGRPRRGSSRALDLHQVGQQVELRCQLRVLRQRPAHAADDTRAFPRDWPADARHRLPADLQRAREPRGDDRARSARCCGTATACS